MSFRSDIMDYLRANWTRTDILELDDYVSFEDLPEQAVEDTLLLVHFPVAEESIVSIAVHQAQGWRQDGICQLLLAKPIGIPISEVLVMGEELQALFRGRRIGDTVVNSISPIVAQFVEGKWQVWSSQMVFYRDLFQ